MGTRSIDIMLSRPGIYVVLGSHTYFFVEVDSAGLCYQLEPHSGEYRRDGELRPGHWFIENVTSIDGPFARHVKTPEIFP